MLHFPFGGLDCFFLFLFGQSTAAASNTTTAAASTPLYFSAFHVPPTFPYVIGEEGGEEAECFKKNQLEQ